MASAGAPLPPAGSEAAAADSVGAATAPPAQLPAQAPQPLTLGLVLNSAAASGTTVGDVLSAYDDVVHSACFRKALAWGGGVAGALVAHSLRGGRSWRRAFNTAFLGFLVVFYAQWWACKEDEYYQRLSLRQKLQEKQQRGFAAGLPASIEGGSASSVPLVGAGGGGSGGATPSAEQLR